MKENLHEIDQLFKSGLNDADQPPPPEVWNEIEKKLDSSKVALLHRKYWKLKMIAAALIIIVFGFSFYELKSWNSSNPKPTSEMINMQRDEDDSSSSLLLNNKAGRPSTEDNVVHRRQTMIKKEVPLKEVAATGIAHPKIMVEASKADSEIYILSAPGKSQRHNSSLVVLRKNSRTAENGFLRKHNTPAPESRKRIPENVPGLPGQSVVASGQLASWEGFPALAEDGYGARTPDVKAPGPFNPLYFGNHLHVSSITALAMPATPSATVSMAKKTAHRFSVTAYVSRDYNSNCLKADQPQHREEERDEIKRQENNGPAFSFGVLVDYALSGNWKLQSGIGFSSSVIEILPKTIYARRDNRGAVRFRYNCSSGYSFLEAKTGSAPAIGDSMYVSGSRNTLQYLALPLSIKYQLNQGRLSFAPELGLNLNLLLNQNIVTEINNGPGRQKETMKNIEGLKPAYMSGIFGVNVQYRLNDNLSFVFNPETQLGLTSINKNAPVRSYRQTWGLAAGVQLQLTQARNR